MISVKGKNGMSRYSGYGYRNEVDGLLWLDMPRLKELGYLVGYVSREIVWTSHPDGAKNRILLTVSMTSSNARLVYTTTDYYSGEKTDYDYLITLTYSSCNYGGRRWWFVCPLTKNGVSCGRRVRKLYLQQGLFGCRKCHNLCYSSQNENRRSAFKKIYALLEYEQKAEEIMSTIHVPYYKGKPTRKMKRYLKYERLMQGGHWDYSLSWLDEWLERGVK